MQFASCEYYFTQVLQNCGVLFKEPEARCTTWRCAAGAVNQFLTASVHGCSTAASGKFRVQVSKDLAYGCPTVVSYKFRCAVCQLRVILYWSFLKTAVCCARNQRLGWRGQAVPGKPRCTVKPSTTSAWVEVMLNPPSVDWRIVNNVHDGYRTLSRYECNVARSKPRSFSNRGGKNSKRRICMASVNKMMMAIMREEDMFFWLTSPIIPAQAASNDARMVNMGA